MAAQKRFTFTVAQLEQYFDRIALPQSKQILDVSNLNNDEKLSYLTTLLKHHQIRIPFENLTQHYSWHKVIDTKPLHVFRKVINQPGRGGYCMENNSLFHNVLLSMGFDCYLAAGRVWAGERWTGWGHLINVVIIDDIKYLCDVGFGSNEPTQPLPLQHGSIRIQISPSETRLVFETIEQNLSDSKLWICQFRVNAESEWSKMYCFTETEILPTDIPGLNYSPWVSRSSYFTQNVICVRFTTNKETDGNGLPDAEAIDNGEIDGTLIIDNNRLKWRRHGKNMLDADLISEYERVKALERFWGIELDVEDREAITGTVGALKTKERMMVGSLGLG